MIIIKSDAGRVCADLLEPLIEALCVDDEEVTPRVQIAVEPGLLTAATPTGLSTSMRAETDARTVFTVDGEYLLNLYLGLGEAHREGAPAIIRVAETWFAIQSPGPRHPETELPAEYEMTAVGPAFLV